jgi:CRISPR/Cas system-associated exonuclease Cas4 (RecB family)
LSTPPACAGEAPFCDNAPLFSESGWSGQPHRKLVSWRFLPEDLRLKDAITKSDWLTALGCPARAWHALRVAPEAPTEADQFRMQQGQEIGALARKLYPDGVMIPATSGKTAAQTTQNVIADGAKQSFFEATASAAPFVAKADILRRHDGAWHVLEVKSRFADNDRLDELVDDLAYTAMVFRRAGLSVARASLVLLSRNFRFGDAPDRLFETVDVTSDVMARAAEFDSTAEKIAKLLFHDTPPPPVLVSACRGCQFFDTKCLGAGLPHTVLEIPGLHHKKLKRLSEEGIVDLTQLPDDFELNENQERTLEEMGLRGWPKTSGSRGMHINVRVLPRWTFTEVRRAALALSRAIERRIPHLASSKWWKEERHGVFLDYNQNAKDRTTCSAYSVRPLPDARVSTPLHWHEVPDADPADFTVLTVPRRFAEIGDPHADMDSAAGTLDRLLELAAKDEKDGLADAPWPPHFRKMEGEAPRVAPSRTKGSQAKALLITVANSRDRQSALDGLERWKAKHAFVAPFLSADDILVDSMRGRSSTWTRIRVNLRHVPEDQRPPQETPDPDDDPTRAWRKRR